MMGIRKSIERKEKTEVLLSDAKAKIAGIAAKHGLLFSEYMHLYPQGFDDVGAERRYFIGRKKKIWRGLRTVTEHFVTFNFKGDGVVLVDDAFLGLAEEVETVLNKLEHEISLMWVLTDEKCP